MTLFRLSKSQGLLSVALLFFGLSVVRSGSALVIPYEVYFPQYDFPADGLIVGRLNCYGACEMEEFVFYGPTGEALSGTFLDLEETLGEGWFAWQSGEELPVGSYTVSRPDSWSTSFQVEEPTGELPTIDFGLRPFHAPVEPGVSCVEPSADGIFFGFYVEETTSAHLHMTPGGLHALQYQYELVGDQLRSERFFQGIYSYPLGTEEREVCFQVWATPLLGGDAVQVAEGCLDTASLGPLGTEPADADYIDAALRKCTVPPTGYEARWCSLFESGCDDPSYEASCLSAQQSCGFAEGEPGAGETSSGDSGDASSGDPASDESSSSTGGEPDELAYDEPGCSCRLDAVGRPAHQWSWQLGGACAVAFVLSRRRRKAG